LYPQHTGYAVGQFVSVRQSYQDQAIEVSVVALLEFPYPNLSAGGDFGAGAWILKLIMVCPDRQQRVQFAGQFTGRIRTIVTEASELLFVLAIGRRDHQRERYREKGFHRAPSIRFAPVPSPSASPIEYRNTTTKKGRRSRPLQSINADSGVTVTASRIHLVDK
jgi:hypothetical protein